MRAAVEWKLSAFSLSGRAPLMDGGTSDESLLHSIHPAHARDARGHALERLAVEKHAVPSAKRERRVIRMPDLPAGVETRSFSLAVETRWMCFEKARFCRDVLTTMTANTRDFGETTRANRSPRNDVELGAFVRGHGGEEPLALTANEAARVMPRNFRCERVVCVRHVGDDARKEGDEQMRLVAPTQKVSNAACGLIHDEDELAKCSVGARYVDAIGQFVSRKENVSLVIALARDVELHALDGIETTKRRLFDTKFQTCLCEILGEREHS